MFGTTYEYELRDVLRDIDKRRRATTYDPYYRRSPIAVSLNDSANVIRPRHITPSILSAVSSSYAPLGVPIISVSSVPSTPYEYPFIRPTTESIDVTGLHTPANLTSEINVEIEKTRKQIDKVERKIEKIRSGPSSPAPRVEPEITEIFKQPLSENEITELKSRAKVLEGDIKRNQQTLDTYMKERAGISKQLEIETDNNEIDRFTRRLDSVNKDIKLYEEYIADMNKESVEINTKLTAPRKKPAKTKIESELEQTRNALAGALKLKELLESDLEKYESGTTMHESVEKQIREAETARKVAADKLEQLEKKNIEFEQKIAASRQLNEQINNYIRDTLFANTSQTTATQRKLADKAAKKQYIYYNILTGTKEYIGKSIPEARNYLTNVKKIQNLEAGSRKISSSDVVLFSNYNKPDVAPTTHFIVYKQSATKPSDEKLKKYVRQHIERKYGF